ncbi:hypothetical protein [Chitinimonas lacunae]|uniref:Uncharacterized protein n=1 Tax=Chitinimonas lacunae TaxID=1963018 RepID=A0ABV8MVU7_9NEIS
MSQQFKHKAIATSVVSALSLIGGAVAMANGFAASTNALGTGQSAATVSADSSGFVPASFYLKEQANTLGGSNLSTAGYITIKLNNARIEGGAAGYSEGGATFSGANSIGKLGDVGATTYAPLLRSGSDVFVSDTTNGAKVFSLGATTLNTAFVDTLVQSSAGTIGRLYYDATNKTRSILLAVAPSSNLEETLSIHFASLAPLSSTSAGDVSVTLVDGFSGSNTTGITGGSLTLAKLTTDKTAVKGATTVPSVTAKSSSAQAQAGVEVTGVTGAAYTGLSTGTLELELDSGAKWFPGLSTTLSGTTQGSAGWLSVSGVSITKIEGVGTGKIVLTLGDTSTSAAFHSASRIEVVSNYAALDTSAVAGSSTIKLSVKSTGSLASINSQVSLATTIEAGVTAKLVDKDNKDVTTPQAIFAGRTGVTLDNFVQLNEKSPQSIKPGILFTVSLDKGALFKASSTLAFGSDSEGNVPTPASISVSSATASVNASTQTSDTKTLSLGYFTVGNTSNKVTLDLSNATAGDLMMTVSGNELPSNTVKVAEIKAATTSSVTGTAVNVIINGPAVAMPEIVIAETAKGALDTSGTVDNLAIQLPTGVVFDKTTAPTVKVYNSAGTEVTTSSLITAPATTHFGNSDRDYRIELGAGWSTAAANGPLTIKVSGLRVKATSSAVHGDANIIIGGTDEALTSTADSKPASSTGAKAYKQTLKFGSILNDTTPIFEVTPVADQTKATLIGKVVASGMHQGKPGAVYAAVIFNGSVFFLNSSGSLELYNPSVAAPAYYTGNLSEHTVNFITTPLDLTPFKGAQLLFGYGLGLAPLGDPFKHMIDNANYKVVYTVQ